MRKYFPLALTLIFAVITATAQTYHEDDKEGLRVFLRQPSAVEGKINAEQLGLEISDTLNWQTDEEWVTKIVGLIWNDDTPKRFIEISYDEWFYKNLAGTLNASKWTKLQKLYCDNNQLTALDISANTELQVLGCSDNQLTVLDISANTELQELICYNNFLVALDLSANTKLQALYCSYNQLTALDISANTELQALWVNCNYLTVLDLSTNTKSHILSCYDNHLLLSDLFAASELWKNSNYLGRQTLPPQTVNVSKALEFSTSQNKFKGIYTEFAVIQNDNTASKRDYTVNKGKIKFKKSGIYTVKMTNKAIISDPEYPAEVIFEVRVTK